jgi:hypothetical protein
MVIILIHKNEAAIMDMKKAEFIDVDYALTMYAEDRETAVEKLKSLQGC